MKSIVNVNLLFASLLFASLLSIPVFANSIVIPPSVTESMSIEDQPGVYFQSNQLRAQSDLSQQRSFSLQILKPHDAAASRDALSAKQSGNIDSSGRILPAETTDSSAQRTGCPELALDSAVYTNFTAQGQIQCYSVGVTSATKIESLLVNIPQEVDYNLYFFKLEADDSLTLLDTSNSPTASIENTVQKVTPGIYIIAAEATTGVSEQQAIMGWFSYPGFDSQEANDKAAQATPLKASMTIQGNMDNANDLDYLVYQTAPDQTKLKLQFSASEQFTFEVWTGSVWASIPHNDIQTIATSENSSVYFLVRGTTDNPPPVSAQYALTVSDAYGKSKLSSLSVWNNENLTNLIDASVLEAHQSIGMSGSVLDVNGNPVPFAPVNLYAVKSDGIFAQELVSTNEEGQFSTEMALPDCAGSGEFTVERRNRTYHGSATNPELTWRIGFDVAAYGYQVSNPLEGEMTNFSHTFYHVCKEKIIQSCYWQRDYQNGGEEYKCHRY